MLADLHIHTTISDGSFTAREITQQALALGITHLAFTDHDTTEAAWAHKALAEAAGIQAVTGVEMSAYDYENHRKVHILGYGYTGSAHIDAIGHETLAKRHANSLSQIATLQTLGYDISPENVATIAGPGRTIYKQHILDFLVESRQSEALFGEIYRTIFKNGGPCDHDIAYPAAEDCIRAIKVDGGLAVLAHPGQLDSFEAVPRFVQAGLDGIEYNHPSHTAEDKRRVQEIASRYGLFMTGGSDFHGRYERTPSALADYPAPESALAVFS